MRHPGRPHSGPHFEWLARLLAFLLALPLPLAIPAVALAEEPPLYGGNDWYMSAYGVLGISNADADGLGPTGGAALSAGFRFNRWLAAEVGGEWVNKFSYDRGTGPVTCTGTGGGSDFYTAWQVSGGGRLYLTESLVQPYLLGHAGFIQTRDRGGGRACKGDGAMARLGGGVEVFVTNGMAVSLLGAYVLPFAGKARDHEYISVGFGLTWY